MRPGAQRGLQAPRLFPSRVPAPTSDHSVKPEALKAKTLSAQRRDGRGAVLAARPPASRQDSQRCQMNAGPRRLHGAGHRHQGLWLARSLLNEFLWLPHHRAGGGMASDCLSVKYGFGFGATSGR